MTSRLPVITGLGIVSAAGCGMENVWQSIRSGTEGLKPLTLFPSPRYGPVLVGEIREDLSALGAPPRGSRGDRLGWLAACEAIQSAGIQLDKNGDRAGIVLGASVGGSFDSERFMVSLIKRKRLWPRPTRFHECISTVDLIADEFGLYGPSLAVATACSSGALAIATAAEMIEAGDADVMLAGGADSLARITWGGFHSLLLVDGAGCRPFDQQRGGMSLGEGAAMLLLETEEHARARGATILARLSGWGASCDAFHATKPHPDGAGALAAMQSALSRAGLQPGDIDYVNAHGTGTRDNDIAEGKALRSLFGETPPPFSSTKRFFGHALAASGAMEAALCVQALRRQEIPPNPGFTETDPAIGLTPVTALRPAPLRQVMSNSFGFGGNNAVLVFSAPDAAVSPQVREPEAIVITGVGIVGPGQPTLQEIDPPLPSGKVLARVCELDAATLTAQQRRRLSRLAQMTLIAARQCAPAPNSPQIAVAIGSGMGCLEAGAEFLENMITLDEREPMPAQFSGSVHNAAAAQVAIDLGARALNATPTAGEISFECALWQAKSQLQQGTADFALAGAADELNKYVLGIGQRWGLWTDKILPGEGAAAVRLERASAAEALARLLTVRLGRYGRPFDPTREAAWVAEAVRLEDIDVLLTGAGGLAVMEPAYQAITTAILARASGKIQLQTYKQDCGEFHAASAFGFARAVALASEGKTVLLYTLSPRGAKALCCVGP